MLAEIGPTLDTTYALQLRGDNGSWSFYSGAEYTSAAAIGEVVAAVYGGAFAAPDMHRVIKIERTVVQ